eukprot:CAMPEP_0174921492 /NCGR_PEP_ID=MMETSP1355-20121228/5186_1 /TAXON_ID=464990 /ORGANISM="Hemiselmis tepida, Strain CCMP443" /LENGTH=44 /DNA_ID= /DNA_START= /DNA_END= /DNA_ORIENTATION=
MGRAGMALRLGRGEGACGDGARSGEEHPGGGLGGAPGPHIPPTP